jgi:hypothetical protein
MDRGPRAAQYAVATTKMGTRTGTRPVGADHITSPHRTITATAAGALVALPDMAPLEEEATGITRTHNRLHDNSILLKDTRDIETEHRAATVEVATRGVAEARLRTTGAMVEDTLTAVGMRAVGAAATVGAALERMAVVSLPLTHTGRLLMPPHAEGDGDGDARVIDGDINTRTCKLCRFRLYS